MYNGNISRSSIVEMLILLRPVPRHLGTDWSWTDGSDGSTGGVACHSLDLVCFAILCLAGGGAGGTPQSDNHTPTSFHKHTTRRAAQRLDGTRRAVLPTVKTSQVTSPTLHSTPIHPLVVSMTKIISLLAAMAVVVKPTSAFVPSPSSSDARIASSATRTYASKNDDDDLVTDRRSAVFGLAGLAISPFVVLPPSPANARLEGVNKPELLPSEPGLNVIQVEKFLTKGQEKRVNEMLTSLEKDTGFRVKLLCQAYPRTPGERFVIAI